MALVDGPYPGTLKVKSSACSDDLKTLEEDCPCPCCRNGKGYSRSKLYMMMKAGEPLAVQLMTSHNIAYMMRLGRNMRKAIFDGKYEEFVRKFVGTFFPNGFDDSKGGDCKNNNNNNNNNDNCDGDGDGDGDGSGSGSGGTLCYPRWVVDALYAAGIDLRKS